MAEDTKSSETKEVPRDTMHSGPQAAPDMGPAGLTTNPVTRELAEKGIAKPAPDARVLGEQSIVTAGEFDPDQSLGTLVTDIKGSDDQEEPVVLNPGQEAPDTVAQQPGESVDEAGERIASQSKEADSRKKAEEKEAAKSGGK